jgi:hypothetical protein
MKKQFLTFAMLASVAASAQNMQITPISATYTASPVIQFKVGWTGARTYRHNTKVWVFVDYRKIENNAPTGSWTRAAVTVTPAINSTPASTATLVSGNDNGFWLNGADGDYSATLTVPLALAADVTQFNWCAYATDYPPNVVIHGNSSYTLRGSRPFIINGTALDVNQSTYSGTIISFTDATGAPGIFPAALNEQTNEMGCVAGLVENQKGICIAPSIYGCTDNIVNLGAVSFSAGSEIQIVGNGITQIWSRPVTASGCQKTSYNAGQYQNQTSDCRTNPGYAGDLFSGCAAVRYAASLCPPPWRVPSRVDMERLLLALGSATNYGVDTDFVDQKLLGLWGGEPNGRCLPKGTLDTQGKSMHYQALSWYTDDAFEVVYWFSVAGYGVRATIIRYNNEQLIVYAPGYYNYAGSTFTTMGTTIRCVKDEN